MRQIKTAKWQRISKAKAKKAFLNGDGNQILVVPCNISPDNVWGIGAYLVLEDESEEELEKFLYKFCWYNCQHAEWGKYPAFYERRHD